MSIAVSARANAVMMALAVALAGGPAAAHHVGVFVPRDNEVSANFKQIKFALQARKFDVALRLFDNGALRAEMRARAADLPAGLEAATRGAIGAGDVPAAERWLMVFFAALARDLAREADRRLADPGGSAEARGAVGRKFLEAITRYYSWNSVSCAEFMRTTKFHKYYFSNQPDSRQQANGLAKYILDKMGKKVYIFYTDYAMGQSDGRQFKTALERLGGEVVGVAGAPLDTKDFSPWFGAINASGADVLFLAFAGTDSLRLMTQLHSFGMTKKYKLAGIDCFLLQQDLAAIAEPMEGFVQLNHFSAYNPDPNMQAFNQKFKKKFGVDANIAAGAYDAVYFWKTAVEKAGSFDSDKVSAAHEGLCTDATHIGRQCIRKEDHQVVMDMHLYRVEKGKNLPIARIDGKDAIGAAMVGQDPLKGFTWEIKKK